MARVAPEVFSQQLDSHLGPTGKPHSYLQRYVAGLGALRRLDLRDGRGDLRVLTVSRLPFLPLLLLLQGQVERLHDHQVLHVQVPRRHERLVRCVVQ